MDVRVLKYFLAVAREGSLTGAAKFLHLSQPALSRQIKELEDELGARLFIRHSHSLSLTQQGLRLRKRAEEILDLVEKTRDEFATPEEDIGGDIHIGAGETKAMRQLGNIIAPLLHNYPFIRIHLHSGNKDDIAELLDKGLLDFGVLIQPADLSKYDYINFPDKEIWGLIIRKDHPLAKKLTIKKDDLYNEPLFFSRQAMREGLGENKFVEWFKGDFDNMKIAGTFNLVYNAAILAECGVGHVLTIDGLADVSENSPLCFRPLEPRLETGLNIVWKKYQVFSPAASLFLQKIQQSFG